MIDNLHDRIGTETITELVADFYRQVPDDDVMGPMYPADDLAGAEKRLRDFLIMRTGGPATYLQDRGHPRLRMRHAPFHIDQVARDRWLQLMGGALERNVEDESDRKTLSEFFEMVADAMVNRG